MKKTLNFFSLSCLTLLLTSCGAQEPAPVEYGTSLSRNSSSHATGNPLVDGGSDSDRISSRSFEDNSRDEREEEKDQKIGGFLRDKNSQEKASRKFITEDSDDNIQINVKSKKIEEEIDLDSELNSIEDDKKATFIPEQRKPNAILLREQKKASLGSEIKEEIIQPNKIEDEEPLVASYSGKWQMPVHGKIVSKFGDLVNGAKNAGINIEAPIGTPVNAVSAGTVSLLRTDGKFGNLVIIKHSNSNIQTAYAHLDTINVSQGQLITGGDEIGTVGQTGGLSKPMLHFAVREGKIAVDPMKYIK